MPKITFLQSGMLFGKIDSGMSAEDFSDEAVANLRKTMEEYSSDKQFIEISVKLDLDFIPRVGEQFVYKLDSENWRTPPLIRGVVKQVKHSVDKRSKGQDAISHTVRLEDEKSFSMESVNYWQPPTHVTIKVLGSRPPTDNETYFSVLN